MNDIAVLFASHNNSESSASPTTHSRWYPICRRHFLQEVPEDLQCPLCYENAVNCQTVCKHLFCRDCISYHISCSLGSRQRAACPLCRQPLCFATIGNVDGELLRRVGQLIVACKGQFDGCTMSGPLSEVLSHERECGSVGIPCQYRREGCGVIHHRRNACAHEYRCRYNPGVRGCKYQIYGCKIRGTHELLSLHEGRCVKRNMNNHVCCPNKHEGCGLLLRRHALKKHLETCPFSKNAKSAKKGRYTIELALAWKVNDASCKISKVKRPLSKFLPKIKEVKEGRIIGEITVVFDRLPISALKGIVLACNPSISGNLKQLNLIYKGVNIFVEQNCSPRDSEA